MTRLEILRRWPEASESFVQRNLGQHEEKADHVAQPSTMVPAPDHIGEANELVPVPDHTEQVLEMVPAVDAGRYSIPPFEMEPATINVAFENRDSLSAWLDDVDLSRFERKVLSFTVKACPMGAVRMTRADKSLYRPAVRKYFAYKNLIKASVGTVSTPDAVYFKAYIGMPASWSKKKQKAMLGRPHRQRPDRDNIDKGICDALFDEDCFVWSGGQAKFWTARGNERIELKLVYYYRKA